MTRRRVGILALVVAAAVTAGVVAVRSHFGYTSLTLEDLGIRPNAQPGTEEPGVRVVPAAARRLEGKRVALSGYGRPNFPAHSAARLHMPVELGVGHTSDSQWRYANLAVVCAAPGLDPWQYDGVSITVFGTLRVVDHSDHETGDVLARFVIEADRIEVHPPRRPFDPRFTPSEMAAVAAVSPAAVWWLVRRRRRAVRQERWAAGLCPSCGFDLRASRGRCPECGAPVAPEGERSQ